MPIFLAVLFMVLVIYLTFARLSKYKRDIHNEIEAMGGEVISIEQRNFFSGIGPFHVVGKGRVVYRIVYKIQGVEKEGWVRFGNFMGPDWRLD